MRCAPIFSALAGMALLLAGCGPREEPLIPVSGIVRVNGELAPHANLSFRPDEDTRSVGGAAITGLEGRYEVLGPNGKKGLVAGAYRVVITRPLRKDGTPPPPGVGPIDSDARETLPDFYCDPEKTILKAVVEPGKSIDFDLKVRKRS